MSIVQTAFISDSSLGNVAKHAANELSRQKSAAKAEARALATRARFSMQDRARFLVPQERVARCCRYLRAGESHVEVLHSPSEGRAHYGSVEVCSSVWLCPVCATKIAELRRKELAEAVQACTSAGGAVLHLTYTVQHDRGSDLKLLLDAFVSAYRRLTSYRGYKALRSEFQIFGAVRAMEVTHGDNGWHPHYHVLLFLSHPLTEKQLGDLDCSIRNLWHSAAKKDGLSMNRHGFSIKATGGAIADYVAKYGRDPKFDPWGPESELTKAHIKSAKSAGGRTPWDLLRDFDAGDMQAAALWREYAGVFKGRQQLVWSPHLRALLGLEDEKTDADLAGSLPDDAAHLVWITFQDWQAVLWCDARGQLLNVAAGGDAEAVRAFIAECRERRAANKSRWLAAPVLARPRPMQLPLGLLA